MSTTPLLLRWWAFRYIEAQDGDATGVTADRVAHCSGAPDLGPSDVWFGRALVLDACIERNQRPDLAERLAPFRRPWIADEAKTMA
jgi:hypothetical protein